MRRNSGFIAAHLDFALACQGFMDLWEEVDLLILPMVSSDHHPIRLRTSLGEPFTPRPFRFQDMWTMYEAFFPFVRDYWISPVPFGNPAHSYHKDETS